MAGKGRVFKRGNRWWVAYYREGKEYREAGGDTRAEALQTLADRLRERLGGVPVAPKAHYTVNQLLDGLAADYTANQRKSAKETAYHALAVRRRIGHLWVAQITRAFLVELRDIWLKAGTAPATINRRFAALRRAWHLAEEQVGPPPKFPMLQERNTRQGFFEREEVERLTQHLPSWLSPMVWFAYYTGWRRGEIRALRWGNVYMTDRIIRLTPQQTKTNQGRVVAIEGELEEVIRAQQRTMPQQYHVEDFVFHCGGKPIPRDIRSWWGRACREAGLEGKLFHDLRRTAARNMRKAGVPETVIMAVMGHKTRAMFDRYNIVDETDIRNAMRRVT